MAATDTQIAQPSFFARHKFAIGLVLYVASRTREFRGARELSEPERPRFGARPADPAVLVLTH